MGKLRKARRKIWPCQIAALWRVTASFRYGAGTRAWHSATSHPDGAWGIGNDPNRDRAVANALANCRKFKGQNCAVQAAPCAGDDPRNPIPWPAVTPRSPAVTPSANADPIVGCYQWGNGGRVVIRPDHTMQGGPFAASWKVLNAAQRVYLFTWQQPITSTVTILPDQRSLVGGTQYGGQPTAKRIAGSSGLVGTWHWFDYVASTLTINSDGTYSGVAGNATWRGTWQALKGYPGVYTLVTSDVPKDTVKLAADGAGVSGMDQFGITITGVKTEPCSID